MRPTASMAMAHDFRLVGLVPLEFEQVKGIPTHHSDRAESIVPQWQQNTNRHYEQCQSYAMIFESECLSGSITGWWGGKMG
jgi:hypothetical protein